MKTATVKLFFLILNLGAILALLIEPRALFADQFSFKEFGLDQPACGPAIVAVDPDDTVWIALAKSGKLARFMNGKIRLYELGPDSRPVGVAAGNQSNGHAGVLWIAASYDNKIIKFDTVTGKTREYPIDGENSWPFNVAIAPDGKIWFTERASGRIGQLDPETGNVKHFDLPTPNAGPAGLAVDQKTGIVWFTESYADRVASLNPVTGAVNELKMSDKSTGLVSGPAGLALDGTGGVWFAKLEGKLGHIVSPYNSINVVDVPQEARRPAGITLDAQGNVWMVALDGNAIVRYSPAAEQFHIFPVPTGEPDEKPGVPPFAKTSRPFGIATDHEGNVWFSEQYTGKLGVLDTAPASLKVFAPQGVVHSANPLFSTQVLDRVSGIHKVTLTIDSSPTQLQHGHIDLRHTLPGHHVLSVSVVSDSGLTSQIKTEFDYTPGQQVFLDQLHALQPTGEEGRRLKAKLLDKAAASQKDDLKARIVEIDSSVKQHSAAFKPFNRKLFFAVLNAQLASGGRAVPVSVTDFPPYFAPAELIVHKGDVVAWKYDPPSDGHSISHELHRIEISADAKSSLLRAGEGFSYKFNALGEFVIHDSQHPDDSRLTVRVEK